MPPLIRKQKAAITFLAALTLIGCGSKTETPDSMGQVVLKKLSVKDWRGIYNMGSKEEKEAMGIDQEQYQRLCEYLTEGFPGDLGVRYRRHFKTSETERHYMFTMDKLPLKAPDIDGGSPKELIPVVIRRINGQWHPMICYFPLHLSQFQQEGKQARHERLLKAMEDSHIPYLIMFDSHTKLTIEDQRRVVKGDLQQSEAFK